MNLKFFTGKNYSRALNFLSKNNTLSLSNPFSNKQKKIMLSGFYENFRWGENKKWLGFANALYINKYN